MSSDRYPFPVAVSRLGDGDSREAQNTRAITWLQSQPGGALVVVTPRKEFAGESLKRLVSAPGTLHLTWRGMSSGVLHSSRVLYAWPDKDHLDDLWGVGADAIAVIEWGEPEAAEWIEDAQPVQLFPGRAVPTAASPKASSTEPLPNGVDKILEHVARMAAGYSSGLKWNEEDMVKADMMNRPERWASVTVEQVRAKCRALQMRPKDVETITGFLARRKAGHRFNVQSSYRGFTFR
ncbi:hypothetical protein HII28_19495 [Planctomonas sp. JC2975]|nr:hypothetical protein [Planctomonas sp. JC2975]